VRSTWQSRGDGEDERAQAEAEDALNKHQKTGSRPARGESSRGASLRDALIVQVSQTADDLKWDEMSLIEQELEEADEMEAYTRLRGMNFTRMIKDHPSLFASELASAALDGLQVPR